MVRIPPREDRVSGSVVFMEIVYFSNVSENTHRFVQKLNVGAHRIPLRATDTPLTVDRPYLLITPTYGGGLDRGAVPKQVIHFLNDPQNRALIRGVIAAGNTNFGSSFCLAGEIIADKCGVPLLHRFELLGTFADVIAVKSLLALTSEMEYA